MLKKIAFILNYKKNNKNSFNALIAALETTDVIDYVDVFIVENNLYGSLSRLTKNYEMVIVGFSFFTTQIFEIIEIIKNIRKNFNREVILLAGGPHPTGDPIGTLKMGFDLTFLGEAEESLIEFFKKMINNEDYKKIKGIAYLDQNGRYIFTRKRQLVDLNRYPPFPLKHGKSGPIEITRGCPYMCYFCQTPYILGNKPRYRSIDEICKYVKILKDRKQYDVRFITPNAFSYGSIDGKILNLSRLEELLIKLKEITNPNGRIFLGSFPSEVRPEHVNENTIRLIKTYCYNDNIVIGAQSGSQRVLDLCHREHTIPDIENSVELALKAGFKAYVDFIFGLPEENEEDIKLTTNLMGKLAQMGAKIHAHSFIPLPQTPFAKKSPKKIRGKVQKSIKTLTSTGFAFGDWKTQEHLAIRIFKYLKEGEK